MRRSSDGLVARLQRSSSARFAVWLVVEIIVVGCATADRVRPTAPRIATVRAHAIGPQVTIKGGHRRAEDI
jgi:hypothetical protein